MKKKRIGLFIGLIVLVGLGWYTMKLLKGRGHSDENFVSFNFEIKDTALVDKVIITESNGMEIELVRNGKHWTDKNGSCVQQMLIDNVLDAAYNVHFKGYIPEKAMHNVTSHMATVGTKVQFYVDGDWAKTWYIGTSTSDHAGTYMLLEDADNGKSEDPVIAELVNMKGIIGPRFFADPRKWQCTNVFSYQINEIASVDVKFSKTPQRNFNVKAMGNKFEVRNNSTLITGLNDGIVTKYLSEYKRINYELPNYELTKRQVDSLKSSTPYCTLELKTKKGNVQKLKMYRRKSDSGQEEVNDLGEMADYDINRFWCVLPSGEVVKCQYFVFDKITRGDIYFGIKK